MPMNSKLRVHRAGNGAIKITVPKKDVLLSIASDGTITAIYDDDLVDLFKEGSTEIVRASNVEPAEGGWIADMEPVAIKFNLGLSGHFDLKLGPFTLRNDALEAERQWIVERILA